jgi:hypothetical protein
MKATQAMKVYRKGDKVRLVSGVDYAGRQTYAVHTIEGTSLGMEIARGARHRKLVLYVKFHGLPMWYPHYILQPPQ